MEKQKIIIMLNCLVMRKSFWKLQLPWTFHCLLYPEGGELEPEVSSLSSGTPNTRVISLNMEVFKVLNSSLSWENGSTKGLQGPGFEAWWMCSHGPWFCLLQRHWMGHFEHNFFPGEREFGRGVQVVQASIGHIVKKKNLIVYASEARPTFSTVIAGCYG